jgi:hypothetical protein
MTSEGNKPERDEPAEVVQELVAPRCSMCRRERTIGMGEHPMDAYDYSPLQVIGGKSVGWYSGDDGEMCPECMTRTLANQ